MNLAELAELILNGENSGVEFKRDDVRPEQLAKEMAALFNLEGGHILLGVEDGGVVSGLTRQPKKAEEWVMEAARTHLRPAAIPYWETIETAPGKIVGIVSLSANAPDKPYKAKRGSAWVTQVRVGTTTRDATDEEEARLYQQASRLSYELIPVPGATLADLDRRRLINYFRDIQQRECPDEHDEAGWRQLLTNTKFMVRDHDRAIPSTGGLILFGSQPDRFLPRAGIRAIAYSGIEKDYDAKEDAALRGPAVALRAVDGSVVETGTIERALEFVKRNIAVTAWIDGAGRRQERWDYPLESIREAVVNAVAHRDYSIGGAEVEISIYADRLEVISPGRLPNTASVENVKAGYRVSRNHLLADVLRDYRYVDARGLGIPRKIIKLMKEQNASEPEIVETENRFIVRLRKRIVDQ